MWHLAYIYILDGNVMMCNSLLITFKEAMCVGTVNLLDNLISISSYQ